MKQKENVVRHNLSSPVMNIELFLKFRMSTKMKVNFNDIHNQLVYGYKMVVAKKHDLPSCPEF